MSDSANNKTGEKGKALQNTVFYACIVLTALLVVAVALLARQYSKNADYVVSRAVVLKGVEPPSDSASDKTVREWISKYSDATPGCVCALGRPNANEKNSALLLCIGYSVKRGSVPACVIDTKKLPAGVSMTVSPHSDADFRIKFVYILSTITNSEIIAPRTGRL